MLTQKQLKEILHYDPSTGIFTWLKTNRKDLIGKKTGCVLNSYSKNRPTPYKTMVISIKRKLYACSRLANLYMTGKLPIYPKEQMDHINHDSIDNRWKNLRCVTQSINGRNRTLSINNISGFTGVSLCKHNKKWIAHIRINKIFLNLGYFYDKQKAVNARKFAEKKYGFHPNHGYSIKEES